MGICFSTPESIQKYKLGILPNDLYSINIKSFVPKIKYGKIIKIYGNTISIISFIPKYNTLYKFIIQLSGIHCPDLKSLIKNERHVAKIFRDEINNIVGINSVITIKNIKLDNNGIINAYMYTKDNICINNHLIRKRLAFVKYHNNNYAPTDWLTYYNNDFK
jgi:hypothetical protein